MIAASGVPAPSGALSLPVVLGHPQTTGFALGVDGLLALAAGVTVAGLLHRRRLLRRPTAPRAPGVPGASGMPGTAGLPVWRTVLFLVGLALVYVAVGSGLVAYSARPSVVVVQHVLLMMGAPPLLVLGRPAVAWTFTRRARAAPRPDPASDVGPRATRPSWPFRLRASATWTVFYGSMAAFFLTALFPRSLHDAFLLDGSEVWFVAVGLAYAILVVGGGAAGRPSMWARVVAVLAGAPVETAVAVSLLLWSHPLTAGLTPATTRAAGIVLWGGSMLTSGLSLAYVLGLWVAEDTRRGAEPEVLLGEAAPVSLSGGPGSARP